jgi:hypothetical protein
MIYGKTANFVIKALRFSGRIARKIRNNEASFFDECTSLSYHDLNLFKFPDIYHSALASDLIYKELASNKPIMITRFGTIELSTVVAATTPLSFANLIKLATGSAEIKDIGINSGQISALCSNSGFFPKDPDLIKRFVELTMHDLQFIDILASWCIQESRLKKELESVSKIRFRDLEPYMHEIPWSRILEGKKVLVIHPFVDTIKKQYEKRKLLFENPLILPDFNLKTIKAVQSIAGSNTQFSTWFDALESMKKQINDEDFDIAIIGCGAYGMPLAAHVKRIGKKAVHLGGQTQLLFGVKGKRWETGHDKIKMLFNEHWVYPSDEEKPNNFKQVEGGAYW